MILKIKSNNPQFSHLIGKNPSSPPKVISQRKGLSIGWYHDDDYCIKFIDAPDECSYGKSSFEYLDLSQFNSPSAYYNAGDFLKLNQQFDGSFSNEILLGNIKLKKSCVHLFSKMYDNLSFEEICNNTYKVIITNFGSLQDLVDQFLLFCGFNTIELNEIYADPSFVKANMDRVASTDAPYFIRYLMKTSLLSNRESYSIFSDSLHKSKTNIYHFSRFNNQNARINWVLSNVSNLPVLDYGCGDGSYAGPISNKTIYYGLDRDNSTLDKTKERRKGVFIQDIKEMPFTEFDVVLSEVIEHNTPTDLESLIQLLNNDGRVQRILITTPNISFNTQYPISDLRHDDHQFELTEKEFQELLTRFTNFSSDICGVGDAVNYEHTTLGAILTRK